MNIYEDGVHIIFKSCFSKMEKLQLLEYGVLSSSENQFLLTDFFSPLQACLPPLQRWFCISYWFYQQTLTRQSSLPLTLFWTPSCTRISFKFPLYLKSNSETPQKDVAESQQLKSEALLFRRTKAMDTLRRKLHIPLQTPAGPSQLTTRGRQTRALVTMQCSR